MNGIDLFKRTVQTVLSFCTANRLFFVYFVALFVTLFGSILAEAGDKVTYRLKWLRNMSTVGDIVAQANGFFDAQNLEVDLKPGGPERDAIRELELGHADFGVASADQVLQAVSKGAPVVVILQLFQVNPLEWIYLKEHIEISSPKDLTGKRIGVTFGKNDEYIMRTLLAKAGISDRQIHFYSVRLDYTPFFQRKVDLWPVYANTQGIEIGQKLMAAGEPVGFLKPSQFGVNFVANSVVTSQRMLNERPNLVSRFTRALIDGWRYALDVNNAEKVIPAVRQYDRDSSEEVLVAQLQETRRLVLPSAGKTIGTIDLAAWRQTASIMLAHGQLDRPVDVDRFLVIR